MANFAVAASQETIEKANKIMEIYAQNGDKKEDTLLRILDLAEAESVKGTHPSLEPNLKAIEKTLGSLLKQINGIVAGQDTQLAEAKEKLDSAIEEKKAALEQAKKETEEAQLKAQTAEETIKQAKIDISTAASTAQAEIAAIKQQAEIDIEAANHKCEQAIRERDDARTIANEKTASNDLLLKQISDMKEDLAAYKSLQEQYKSLQDNFASLQADLKAKDTELSNQKKESEISLNATHSGFEHQKKTLQAQAALATEQAVIAKERELRKEYQEQLRQADKENAKLSIQIEQHQKRIEELSNVINNSKKE